jgi:hypothetical protein
MENLAREFIAEFRAHGHRAHVDESGKFAIRLFVSNPTAPPEPRQMLDFDTEPYVEFTQTREGIAALIKATREADAHEDHVAGLIDECAVSRIVHADYPAAEKRDETAADSTPAAVFRLRALHDLFKELTTLPP